MVVVEVLTIWNDVSCVNVTKREENIFPTLSSDGLSRPAGRFWKNDCCSIKDVGFRGSPDPALQSGTGCSISVVEKNGHGTPDPAGLSGTVNLYGEVIDLFRRWIEGKLPKSVSDQIKRCLGGGQKNDSGKPKGRKKGSFRHKNKGGLGSPVKCYATFLILFGMTTFENASSAALPLVCRRGYHLHTPRIGPNFCLPCQDGETYIPVDLHSYRQCSNCTKIVDPDTEVLVTQCNKYKDSEILCKSGFYRRLARNPRETDRCEVCSQCQVTTRPCQGYYDSVCCGHPDYDAVLNKDGVYICKEKPIRCGRGEYLRTSTEQCTSCPANTYRPESDHNETECLPCLDTDQDSIINREVVRACNTTHPALFECKPGFFRNVPREDWQLLDEDCRPCHTCKCWDRNCTRLQDMVCCPSSDMVVSENPLGSIYIRPEGIIGEPKSLQVTDLAESTGKPSPESSSNLQIIHDETLPHLAANSMGLFEIFLLIVCLVMAGFHVFVYYYKHICWEILPDARNKYLCVVELICFIGSILILTISAFCVVVNVDKKITTWLNISTVPLLAVSVFIAFHKTYKLKAFILSQKRETDNEKHLITRK